MVRTVLGFLGLEGLEISITLKDFLAASIRAWLVSVRREDTFSGEEASPRVKRRWKGVAKDRVLVDALLVPTDPVSLLGDSQSLGCDLRKMGEMGDSLDLEGGDHHIMRRKNQQVVLLAYDLF